MKILISNTSDSPLYQQIKDQIKDAILKEELVEGDALPSIRAFANDLKVSVLTIRRVYEELEHEGFITSQVGIGTFVSAGNLELLRDSKRRLVEQKMLYMDMFSLDPKRKINTLSKGMKMKYALTLALSHNAELLIMDEPTSGLDPLSRSQLLNVLNDYMENGGKGVLFSTHITSDLDKIADMLIMIHNGRIVFQEEKDFLLDDYRIIKGDKKLLTENIRQLFLNITETAFGFTGVTRYAARVQSYLPDAITERPTIEDIMLANLGGCGK